MEYKNLTRNEQIELRAQLKLNGNNICFSEGCNGIIKQINEFCKGKNTCKKCFQIIVQRSHRNTGRAYRREKNKLKKDKKCVLCGESDPELLEFDHIDWCKKEFSISKSCSSKKIKNESEKTQILCIWCHRLKTQKEITKFKKELNDYEYSFEEENEIVKNGKICNGPLCKGKIRNIDKFYDSQKRKCIKCILYVNKSNRINNSTYITSLKMKEGVCKHCKKKVTLDTECCFDFDHIDMNNKTYLISRLKQSSYDAKKNIDMEIEKCQLLCCFCHLKKTKFQLDHMNHNDLATKKSKKEKNIWKCIDCSVEISPKSVRCHSCNTLRYRTVPRPPKEKLLSELKTTSFLQLGKKYGVSDNTIRKWIK